MLKNPVITNAFKRLSGTNTEAFKPIKDKVYAAIIALEEEAAKILVDLESKQN